MKNLKVMNLTAAAFACLLFFTSAEAQNNTARGGGGGFTFGYGYQDVSKLHEFIPAGVRDFNKQHMLIGGTGHGMNGNFVLGGSGFGIVGDEISTDSFKYKIGGGMGTFDIGYLILNRDKVKVYPMIGIGGGGYSLQIVNNRNLSRSEVLNNPAREINISTGGLILDLSVNLDFIPMLNYNEKDNSYGGFMTGFKIGYLYSMPSSKWTFSGGEVSGGPSFGLNMVYAKLVLGGFGMQK